MKYLPEHDEEASGLQFLLLRYNTGHVADLMVRVFWGEVQNTFKDSLKATETEKQKIIFYFWKY